MHSQRKPYPYLSMNMYQFSFGGGTFFCLVEVLAAARTNRMELGLYAIDTLKPSPLHTARVRAEHSVSQSCTPPKYSPVCFGRVRRLHQTYVDYALHFKWVVLS